MDFASALKSLRLSRGLTQEELSEKTGVSTVAVQGWERGTRKPSFDALIGICSALSVSLDELLGIKTAQFAERPLSRQEQSLLSGYRRLDRFGRRVVDVVCREELRRMDEAPAEYRHDVGGVRRIRRYFIPAAAGFSAPIEGEDYEMILAGPEVPSGADYAVSIQGNSMAPYIFDGDIVYVQRNVAPEVGDVCIFCVDGSMYCKIYYKNKAGDVTLVSANPSLRQSNVHLKNDSGQSIEFLGKVLLGAKVKIPDYFIKSAKQNN